MPTPALDGVNSQLTMKLKSEVEMLAISPTASNIEANKTAVEFEAVFLGTFVEAMLPKSDSMYGGGMAGDMWRSQLSSGIAMQLAQSNLLGLGEQVVRDAQARSSASS
ncbi:rod-binding protein [Ahrensia sp. R2A130]|uniref:rod-binding protein n=1 Tax=Ahrensia sp. R2A130 TaxID=744979 RepID=UPI0001E0F863|nr:rod-binding protein [Ahrensia sp. R2A130]EFL89474.1 putative chemotactic signal-response protein CheL [Ahrensia sp. R2A130]